jgi:hypothetical protein
MELNQTEIELEVVGAKTQYKFGIGDMGLVFELMRHKMYANAIGAVCREVSCNARDAHREVGTSDRPIEITLPTRFDPNFRIRDFGPGISPDRMENVFVNYASSTKRGDNVQTGGFGLGAKTPFAYSNRFNIVTVTGGMRRTYTAVIGEDRKGDVYLTTELPTTEPNGTEIIVPVEAKDFEAFRVNTHDATRHWSVKPVIQGALIDYRDVRKNIVMCGNNWFVTKAQQGYYGDRQIKVLVDEIEYPFDISVLGDTRYSDMFDRSYIIYLTFGVGVLSLAASREQLDADDRTRNAIEDVLESISKELMSTAQARLDGATTLREANGIFSELITSMGATELVKSLKWQGKSLRGREVCVEAGYFENYTISTDQDGNIQASSNGRRSYGRQTRNLISCEKATLVINDMIDFKMSDKAATTALKGVYDPANPNAFTTMQIGKFSDFAKARVDYDLDTYGFRFLSEFVKPRKVSARSYLGRMTFYKFSGSRFGRSSIGEYETDTNVKICVTLHKDDGNEKVCRDGNGRRIDSSEFSRLLGAFGDVSFYGFMHDIDAAKLAEAVTDIKTLDSYIADFMSANSLNVDEMRQVAEFTQSTTVLIPRTGSNAAIERQIAQITGVDSPLLAYLARLEGVKALCVKYQNYMSIGHFMGFKGADGSNDTIEAEHDKIMQRYPLFRSINGYDVDGEALVEYINLVDAVR